MLAFTLVASLLSGILFGLLPAWQSQRLHLQTALKDGGRSATGSHHRIQNLLAVAEGALSLMLLAGAGLLIQTMVRLNKIAPGFQPDHLLTMQVALSPGALTNGAAVAAHRALLARVQHLPGITTAAETALIPLSGNDDEWTFSRAGIAHPAPNQMRTALAFVTSPDYLRAMRIPLLRGRFFNDQDRVGRRQVMVIDESMARDFFGAQDPIGQHIVESSIIGDAEVVGVVGYVKHWGFGADAQAKIQDQMYFPIFQIPVNYMTQAGQGIALVVRTAGPPLNAIPMVRQAVAGPDRDQPVYEIATMEQIIGASLAQQRFLMTLLGLFALVALTLAAIGICGVLSYSVSQRTHEVGIRMALGAQQADVLHQMVGQGTRLALIGAALGVAGALLTTRFLASDLYGVTPSDPWTLAVVTLLLVGLAMLASYMPARRAARVDPVIALRGE